MIAPLEMFEGPARRSGGLWIGTDVRELPPLPSFLVLFDVRIMAAHETGQWLMSVYPSLLNVQEKLVIQSVRVQISLHVP